MLCCLFIWFLQFNTFCLFRGRQRKRQFHLLLLLRVHPTALGFIEKIRREGQTRRLSSSLPPSLLSNSHHILQLLPPPSHSPDPLPSAVSVWLVPSFLPSCLAYISYTHHGQPCEPHVSACARVLPQLTGRTYKVLWTWISDDFYLPSCHICATVQSRIPLLSVQHLDGISNPLELMSSLRGTKQANSGFPSPQFW